MVEAKPIESIPVVAAVPNPVEKVSEPETIETPAIPKTTVSPSNEVKISALSLASIRAKRELQESSKSFTKDETHLPTEDFSETDMLLQWNKYAQRLGDKGHKIMESLLLINDPVLNGTSITLELPNEGSKIDFETEKHGLLGHLRGHLHNHNITIDVIVNEAVETKQAFTTQEKYNRLCEKNPNLEILRKTFDLDI